MAEGGISRIELLFTEIANEYPKMPDFWKTEEGKHSDCYIRSFASWSDFAIARVGDVDESKLSSLMSLVEHLEYTQTKSLFALGRLQVGMPCLAKQNDAVVWERGAVKSIIYERGLVVVDSVDYGENFNAPYSHVLPLPKAMATLYAIAINVQILDAATFAPKNDENSSPKQGPYTFLFLEKDEDSGRLTVVTDPNAVRLVDAKGQESTLDNVPQEPSGKGYPGIQPTYKMGGKTAKYTYNMAMQFLEKLFRVTDYVFATSMEVKEVGGEGRLASVFAESCKLNGGSLKDANLCNLFKEGDMFYMNGKLCFEEKLNDNGERMIKGAEWKVTNILTANAPNVHTDVASVIQGVLDEMHDNGGRVMSRLWQQSIFVPKSVIATCIDKGLGYHGKLDMYRTVAVRCKRASSVMRGEINNCAFLASAIEIPLRAVEATGVMYFVTPIYAVAMRIDRVSEFQEYDKQDQYYRNMDTLLAPFRYCYLPVGVVHADDLPNTEWYGMPVMFRCNEDQPGDPDTPYEPRWKAFKADLNPLTEKTRIFKLPGIWATDYTQKAAEALQLQAAKKIMTEDERRDLIIHPDVQKEWGRMKSDAAPVIIDSSPGPSGENQKPKSSTVDLFGPDGESVGHFEHSSNLDTSDKSDKILGQA